MNLFLRLILLIILYGFGPFVIYAQNMVPNPGFEELKASPPCWTLGSREDFPAYVEDWITPNMGTSDLFSTNVPEYCITAMPYSSVPPAFYYPRGSQMPRSGSNFAGIKPLNDDRREYLEVKLVCPLIPGEEYYAEMYVSLSENTNYAQNSLGMYFSDTLVYTQSFEMLHFTPQIVENSVIADSVNWVKISGTFIATGPAEYLIIGSFATQANTIVQFLGNKGEIEFPYYYIDDVSVQRVNPPPVTISGDTIVCKGDTVHLNASGWQDVSWILPSAQSVISNNNDLIFVPAANQVVTAQSRHCNMNLSKKVAIAFAADPVVNLGKDTMICQGTSLLLDAGSGMENYQWNTGAASQFLTITDPGAYWVTVENDEGCSGKDEVLVNYYKVPEVNLGEDQETCTPEGILEAFTGQLYDVYEWQDYSTAPQYTFSSEGVYWVKVTNICGDEDFDTIHIQKINLFVPNLITSNGDNKNDWLEIPEIKTSKGKLRVYNRYGEEVYKSEGYENNFSGASLNEGVYYYQFMYPACPDQIGWIHISR